MFSSVLTAFLLLLQVSGDFHLMTASAPEPPEEFSQLGLASFELEVASDGSVASDTLLRGPSSFVQPSRLAFDKWKFGGAPARASFVNATFLYKPRLSLPDSTDTVEMPLPEARIRSPYPVTIVEPGFPEGGLADGVVVLDLAIAATGIVDDVSVALPSPGLTDAAVAAARRWRFHVPPGLDAASRTAIVVVSFARPTDVAPAVTGF